MSKSRLKDFVIDEGKEFARKVPVRVPKSAFRIHPNAKCRYLLWHEVDNGWWMIRPDIARHNFGREVKIRETDLYLCTRPKGEIFLLPVTRPTDGSSNSWFEAWQKIVEVGQRQWIKVRRHSELFQHDYEVVKDLEAPDWPNVSIEDYVAAAFDESDRIESIDHPALAGRLRRSRNCSDIEEEY